MVCPKPLLVTERPRDPNVGHAFVRFADKRDLEAAVQAVRSGQVMFDGRRVQAEQIVPGYWPTEKTRRYY